MPRLVRRKPLAERIKAMLNPMDFLLWLSEEIETRDWNSKSVGMQMGIAMNLIFAVARANSSRNTTSDDVFGDDGGSGWLTFIVSTFVWILAGFSTLNAAYTNFRARQYRLFEADVEKEYNTPSAQRVRVQSSPASSSPLRFLTYLVSSESAESRAHPDRTRDVWEISVWDPLPISLQILCWFGPGHVLVSWMFLPITSSDWPSIVGFKWLVLQGIISTQMYLMQSKFSQQNKDTAIIQKEVLHEYDTKFVHPHLYPTVRDASTQISQDEDGNDQEYVAVGTPTTVLRRGFKANPNPNYAKHIDPDGAAQYRPNTSNAGLFTPPISRQSEGFASSIQPRPRHSTPSFSRVVGRTHSPAVSTAAGTTQTQTQPQGGGGYLGVYTHPSSPLKKAPSLGELQHRTPRNNSEMAQLEQYRALQGRDSNTSPFKSPRKSTGTLPSSSQTGSGNWMGNRGQSNERYPSMWR
ncbi:putative Meiotically up-regulated gene 154 protein [Seiridium unicorne]|uniref:Meiotically up-regulated gene 154 protein n=1 Tax=Seiridium unicorne TaxID=138068 RepID=A0ABR2V769_9PEZI